MLSWWEGVLGSEALRLTGPPAAIGCIIEAAICSGRVSATAPLPMGGRLGPGGSCLLWQSSHLQWSSGNKIIETFRRSALLNGCIQRMTSLHGFECWVTNMTTAAAVECNVPADCRAVNTSIIALAVFLQTSGFAAAASFLVGDITSHLLLDLHVSGTCCGMVDFSTGGGAVVCTSDAVLHASRPTDINKIVRARGN